MLKFVEDYCYFLSIFVLTQYIFLYIIVTSCFTPSSWVHRLVFKLLCPTFEYYFMHLTFRKMSWCKYKRRGIHHAKLFVLVIRCNNFLSVAFTDWYIFVQNVDTRLNTNLPKENLRFIQIPLIRINLKLLKNNWLNKGFDSYSFLLYYYEYHLLSINITFFLCNIYVTEL